MKDNNVFGSTVSASFSRFDLEEHGILCLKLRQLYVSGLVYNKRMYFLRNIIARWLNLTLFLWHFFNENDPELAIVCFWKGRGQILRRTGWGFSISGSCGKERAKFQIGHVNTLRKAAEIFDAIRKGQIVIWIQRAGIIVFW